MGGGAGGVPTSAGAGGLCSRTPHPIPRELTSALLIETSPLLSHCDSQATLSTEHAQKLGAAADCWCAPTSVGGYASLPAVWRSVPAALQSLPGARLWKPPRGAWLWQPPRGALR